MSEEEGFTLSEFEVLPIKVQLTILYEELVCRIDPMLEDILDEIRGEEE